MTTDLDAASFLLAVFAFLLSGGAIFYTRRATVASERSAEAAEESAAAAARSAAVAEREEQRQFEEAASRAVRWEARRQGSAGMLLRNLGDGTAFDVHVRVPPDARILGKELPAGVAVEAGGSLQVWATSGHGGDGRFVVSWRPEAEGVERTWSDLLP